MQSFTKSTLPTAVTMPRSRRHRSSTERSRSRTRDRDRDRRRRRLEDSQSYSSKHRSRSSRTRGYARIPSRSLPLVDVSAITGSVYFHLCIICYIL
ncbi:serine/arginine-rich splicing factor 5-like isoform X4 [Cherax quadricarinatus]|uniref:serine/arginine-rich splicing factor 5-like isoform X4 n=1 Tax=Cherax quadricarinatus TaxID=27406 RepID=UPI002379355D|nr:probable RNA-binding protein 23 isoform X2 [Cherax quadricarinatus]XP_053652084.1 probable RNA-binding protein 23 isoform X2 [Cherax quadricarinatus]